MLIYILIFSKIMGAKLPGSSATYSYSVYLVSGIIPWAAFSNTLLRTTGVIVEKQHVLTKIHMSIPLLPFVVIASETITFVVSMTLFGVFLAIVGGMNLRLLPYVLLIFCAQQLLAYGIGFVAAILNVFLKDLKEIVSVVVQVWFWFTPIVYVADIVPNFFREFMFLNPAYIFVDAYHNVFVHSIAPRLDLIFILLGVAFITFWLSLWLFEHSEKAIRDSL